MKFMNKPRCWLSAVSMAILLAACGGSGGSGPAAGSSQATLLSTITTSSPAAPPADASAAPAPASACTTDCLAPGDYTLTLTWDALPRLYMVHVPASYTGSTSVPLLLDLHGGATLAEIQRSTSGQLAQSDKRGFIAVWPQGLDGSWNANGCCLLAYHLNVDDVGFLKAVIATLKGRANINANKVYVTGLSNGGGMTHRMACDAADVVTAVAPMSNPLQIEQCHPSRPITVVTFAGTSDNQVPYAGGIVNGVTLPINYPNVTIGFPLGWQGARASLAAWKNIDGCSDALNLTPLAGGSTDETYLSCNGGVKTGLVSISGGSHDLYNGDALHQIMFAHANYAVDVSEYVWEHVFTQ